MLHYLSGRRRGFSPCQIAACEDQDTVTDRL
jgi:hypothetical protein